MTRGGGREVAGSVCVGGGGGEVEWSKSIYSLHQSTYHNTNISAPDKKGMKNNSRKFFPSLYNHMF